MRTFTAGKFGLAALALLLVVGVAPAQEGGEVLRLGTKDAPPFVMQEPSGLRTGISVYLWERLEAEMGVRFDVQDVSFTELMDRTAAGELDLAVAAITMTTEREERLDFTHPFFTTGLGVVARTEGSGSLVSSITRLFSGDFIRSIGALSLLLLLVGVIVWIAERRKNTEEFGGSAIQGIGSGFWWSAVTMTTVGYGDKSPRSVAGRLIGLVWMFAAIIMISGFTASITSSLTVSRLEGSIRSANDLSRVSVGTVASSTSASYLERRGIDYVECTDTADGISRVASGSIDAFVFDRPVLLDAVRREGPEDVAVLPFTFERQQYGIALPPGSPLRERINRALLAIVSSEEWTQTVEQYLGE